LSFRKKCTEILTMHPRNSARKPLRNNTKTSTSSCRVLKKSGNVGTKTSLKDRFNSCTGNMKENSRKSDRNNVPQQRTGLPDDPLMLLKRKKLIRKRSKIGEEKNAYQHQHHHSMLLPDTEALSYDLPNTSPLSVTMSLSPAELDALSLNLLSDADDSDLDRIIKKYENNSSSNSSILFSIGSANAAHGQKRTMGQRMMNLIITVEKHQRRYCYKIKQKAFSKWRSS